MSTQPPIQKMYVIKLRERLNSDWSDWFDGFQIEDKEEFTILKGHVVDQAALHGLLITIRDLGLTLISVKEFHE